MRRDAARHRLDPDKLKRWSYTQGSRRWCGWTKTWGMWAIGPGTMPRTRVTVSTTRLKQFTTMTGISREPYRNILSLPPTLLSRLLPPFTHSRVPWRQSCGPGFHPVGDLVRDTSKQCKRDSFGSFDPWERWLSTFFISYTCVCGRHTLSPTSTSTTLTPGTLGSFLGDTVRDSTEGHEFRQIHKKRLLLLLSRLLSSMANDSWMRRVAVRVTIRRNGTN